MWDELCEVRVQGGREGHRWQQGVKASAPSLMPARRHRRPRRPMLQPADVAGTRRVRTSAARRAAQHASVAHLRRPPGPGAPAAAPTAAPPAAGTARAAARAGAAGRRGRLGGRLGRAAALSGWRRTSPLPRPCTAGRPGVHAGSRPAPQTSTHLPPVLDVDYIVLRPVHDQHRAAAGRGGREEGWRVGAVRGSTEGRPSSAGRDGRQQQAARPHRGAVWGSQPAGSGREHGMRGQAGRSPDPGHRLVVGGRRRTRPASEHNTAKHPVGTLTGSRAPACGWGRRRTRPASGASPAAAPACR